MRRCYRCRADKELEYFWKRGKWCIRCMRAYRRQPEVRARYRVTEQRWRDRQPSRLRQAVARNEKGQFVRRVEEHAA